MAETRRVLIQRQDNGAEVRERFYVQPGRRFGTWIWFDREEVPSFDGPEAVFEIERRGRRWIVRRPSP